MADVTGTEARTESGPGYGLSTEAPPKPKRRRSLQARLRRYGVHLRVVRHGKPSGNLTVSCAADAARLLRGLAESDRERVVAIWLSVKGEVLGVEEVSVGTLDACVVVPREWLKAGLLMNAASCVLAHCHPSGCPEPSREDYALTERLAAAAKLMGLVLLDHLVIAERGFVDAARRASVCAMRDPRPESSR